MYCDNIISIMGDLAPNEKHVLSAEILIHLLVQYKCITEGNMFKLEISRNFLKFFPHLKYIEAIGDETLKQDALH